jgi:biotin carboxylase
MTKEYVKKELKKLFKSMDFISENFLNREDIKELQTYFDGYQHLGIAWEFLGLQCVHREQQTILRSGIPQEFFKEHISETAAETSGPREVILSEYLIC